METNTKLAIVFALATGLMSSAALAGAVSAGAQSNLHFEIQDVTMEDGAADKIFWSMRGNANSAVEKGNELQDLGIRSPAHPTDPWVFLSDRSEIRRDFVYQPFFERAALAPEIPQDRVPSLMDEYSDNKRIIMALRENPAVRSDNEVLAVIAAAFAAPGNETLNPDGSRVTPTNEQLLEVAANVPTEEEIEPTINSMYILVAARSGLLSREQYSFLAKIYWDFVKHEAAGLPYPLPDSITDALISVKDQVSGILAGCSHLTFHEQSAPACHADAT